MDSATMATNVMVYLGAVFSSIAGFLACCTLYRHTHHKTALSILYLWGTIFFAGAGLLAVNWSMGSDAPIPLRPPATELVPLGMTPLMLVWIMVCGAGIAIHRMLRVVCRPEGTIEGAQLKEQRIAYTARKLAMVLPLLLLASCAKPIFRPIDGLLAEKSAMEATIPFSQSHVEKYPTEARPVELFYETWRSRLQAEFEAIGEKERFNE